ncbi:MAG: glycosyltransferase family 1 protein [Candidatus Omnitrophota bacterium]|jgi:glycosyltransferase involved in cell wall biosynthesis|nr:MAG: glycosyltransferase family 1 protein [Candidatus Omnitrophota bacterium]
MKIGIDARFIEHKTGIGRYCHHIVEGLLAKAINHRLGIFVDHVEQQRIIEKMQHHSSNTELNNIGTSKRKAFHASKLLDDQLLLRSALDRDNLDLLYSPYFNLPILYRKAPVIVTIHDISLVLTWEHYTLKQRLYYGNLLKYYSKHADFVVTDSMNSKQDIIGYLNVDEKKVRVIRPGIPSCKAEAEGCRDYFFDGYVLPKNYILYSGGIAPRKNITTLIKAFEIVRREVPEDYKLIITGPESKYRELLLKYAIGLSIDKDIFFAGVVTDEELKLLYRNAKLTVYPSLYEGFGFPILESLIEDTPVVASNSSSIKELVYDNDMLVEPLDYKGFADRMITLIIDENQYTKTLDIQRAVVAEYCWENTIDELMKLFLETI